MVALAYWHAANGWGCGNAGKEIDKEHRGQEVTLAHESALRAALFRAARRSQSPHRVALLRCGIGVLVVRALAAVLRAGSGEVGAAPAPAPAPPVAVAAGDDDDDAEVPARQQCGLVTALCRVARPMALW